MSTGLWIRGRLVAGEIVQTPLPLQPEPETLNAIVSSPAFALASVIACRSEPAPVSAVVVTVNVAPYSDVAPRSSSAALRVASRGLKAASSELRGVESLKVMVRTFPTWDLNLL